MKQISGFVIFVVLAVTGWSRFVEASDGASPVPTCGRTVCGEGTEEPAGYVPVMLSNGSLCMTADRLLKSLPVKDGRFVPAANSMDAISMGTLAGYFPFPIFPKGHKEQTASVDYFLEHGAAGGNMYSTGKKICPWYCGTMVMAALRAGRGEKAIALTFDSNRCAILDNVS